MATPRAGSVVNKPAGFKPDDGGFGVGFFIALAQARDLDASVLGSDLCSLVLCLSLSCLFGAEMR